METNQTFTQDAILKNKIKYFYCIIMAVLVFASCERKISKNSVMDDMDDLISQNPDSALQILDSYIVSPKDIYNNNRYKLYSIQVKEKLDISIKNDLEIINVYNYFKDIQSDYAGLSAYYCGKVLQQSQVFDKAINYYNIAESFAVERNDLDFRGLVLYAKGEVMFDQMLSDKAKGKFSEARKIFNQTGNYKSEIKSLNSLAITFLLESKHDSALYYYEKADNLADIHNDKKERAYAVKDRGLVYYSKGDYKTAIKLAKEAKEIDSVVIRSGKADLLVSNAFMGLNLSDSAQHYADNAIVNIEKNNSQDLKSYVAAYLLLSEIAESKKDYMEALDKYKLYIQSLEDIIDNDQINATIDAERKYKLEVAEEEFDKLRIKQIDTERFAISLLIVILCITIIYYRLIIKKNKSLSKATIEILNLTDSLTEFDKTKESISDYYNQYYNILKRAASLEYFIHDSGNKQGKSLIKKFNEIAYGQENIDWDILYKIINSRHNNNFDRIRERYPELDETDFKICCLLCSKMNSNEIAIIMQLKVATIHMKTTNIRKKLGIEKYGNVADFLYNNLN